MRNRAWNGCWIAARARVGAAVAVPGTWPCCCPRGACSRCSTRISASPCDGMPIRDRVSNPILPWRHRRAFSGDSTMRWMQARKTPGIRSNRILPCAAIASARWREEFRLDRGSLRGINLGRLEHLRGDARILHTVNGTNGSSGTESALWLYQLDAESRAEFWADRDSYLRNIEAHSIWYGW